MTRPMTPIYLQVTVTLFRDSVLLPYISALNLYFSYFFQIVSENDQTFDPNILTGIGHCDQRYDCNEQLSLKAQPVLSIMYKNL